MRVQHTQDKDIESKSKRVSSGESLSNTEMEADCLAIFRDDLRRASQLSIEEAMRFTENDENVSVNMDGQSAATAFTLLRTHPHGLSSVAQNVLRNRYLIITFLVIYNVLYLVSVHLHLISPRVNP
jgi:hypothetical protein